MTITYIIDTIKPQTTKELVKYLNIEYASRGGTPVRGICLLESEGMRDVAAWDDHPAVGHLVYRVPLPEDMTVNTPRNNFQVLPESVDGEKFRATILALQRTLSGN